MQETIHPKASRAERMVGKTFMYNAREVRIQQVVPQEKQVDFHLESGQVITCEWSEIDQTFLPIEQDKALKTGNTFHTVQSLQQQEASPIIKRPDAVSKVLDSMSFCNDKVTMMKLKDVLLDNIEKVQKDPDYLERARVVNDNIRTFAVFAQAEIKLLETAVKYEVGGKQ